MSTEAAMTGAIPVSAEAKKTFAVCFAALVATSFEGRPIHLDGNPEHPFAGGGIVPGTKRHAGASALAQASILHLYDPERSQNPLNSGKGSSLEAFKAALRPDTIVVSVMFVNNEIGVIQDIAAIGEICRSKGIIFHVDSAQATGKVPVDLSATIAPSSQVSHSPRTTSTNSVAIS